MIAVALSSWSLHTLFLNPEASGLRGRDFPRIAREHFGVGYIEFYEGDYAPDLMEPNFRDEERAREVRRACDVQGVGVVCLAAVNDLTAEDKVARERDRARILRLAVHCEILECPVIRINSGRRRLDTERIPILVQELLRLSDELVKRRGQPVCLAVENHPHVIASDEETDRLIEVVERVGRPNVRLCPDVGAMGPGYWRRGFEKLARWAVHVHLKPRVLDGPPESPEVALTIPAYGPDVRAILQRGGYTGAVAFEGVPGPDPKDGCYQETLERLREVAHVFETPLKSPKPLPARPSPKPNRRANEDKDLAPPTTILQLLADGCERRLKHQVRILDLARREIVFSKSAAHRAGGPPAGEAAPEASHFCALVDGDQRSSSLCAQFYREKVALFQSGAVEHPQVCLCPMGLMVLSVPIMDESQVYGAISCGPWVEQGTEGLIVDSILRHVADQRLRPVLDRASLAIDAYSPGQQLTTRKLVEDLAHDLAGLYTESHLARHYLKEGPKVIRRLQETSVTAPPDPESFLETTLPTISREFEEVAGFGRLGLYRWTPPPATRPDVLRLQSTPKTDGGSLPPQIDLPSIPGGRNSDQIRVELVRQLRVRTPFDVLVADRYEESVFVVFCYPKGRPLSGSFPSLFNQFATEVHYVLDNLRALNEAEGRREELVLFTNRFKHAISSALQGISDRVLRLRRHIEGKKTIPWNRFVEMTHDLTDFSHEAESVLNRFTGLVRLTGHEESLRPAYSFATINLANVLAESVRRWSRSAEKRSIRIKGPDAGSQLLQEGDRNALSELFDNLVENALKFAKDGSVIDATVITVKNVAGPPVLTPPWPLGGPGRRFVIRDQGLGIAPEDLENELIFKPFVQGRAYSYSRVIPGTGVGLAICREIVEIHGGKIQIRSRPALGAEHRPPPENLQDCVVEVFVDLPMTVPNAKPGPRMGTS